jgi:hypothetical protein
MRAIDKAFSAYHAELPGVTWNDAMNFHLTHPNAWVFSSDELFIMARRVDSSWLDGRIIELEEVASEGDSIHIFIAAGEIKGLLKLLPANIADSIKFFTFQKRGYALRRLLKTCVDFSSFRRYFLKP